MLGENAKAEQNFQRALALAPQDSDIRHNWGWYLCSTAGRANRSPSSSMALRNPLYKTPEIALVNAGRCSAAFGDIAGAEAYFRRALARLAEQSPARSYGLALLAFRAGACDEARGWMKRLMQQPAPAAGGALPRHVHRAQGWATAAPRRRTSSQLRNRYPDSAETKAIPTGALRVTEPRRECRGRQRRDSPPARRPARCCAPRARRPACRSTPSRSS